MMNLQFLLIQQEVDGLDVDLAESKSNAAFLGTGKGG